MEVGRQEVPLDVSASLLFSGGISKFWGEVSVFQTPHSASDTAICPTSTPLLSLSLSLLCLGESGSLVLQMKPKPGGFQVSGESGWRLRPGSLRPCAYDESYHGDRAGQAESVCLLVCTAEHVLEISFSFHTYFSPIPYIFHIYVLLFLLHH